MATQTAGKIDFSEYLNVKADDIEKAKPLPGGHYHAKITGYRGKDTDFKQGEGPIPMVEFSCRTTGPSDDVETDELPANGGVGVVVTIDYRLVKPNAQGKIEGGGQSAIRTLAENIGIDTAGLSLGDILDAMKNQDVLVFCDPPREDKRNAGEFYTNAKKILALPK